MRSKNTIRQRWYWTAMAAAGAIALSLAPPLQAQITGVYGNKGLPVMTSAMGKQGGQVSTKMPNILSKVGIDQRLNSQLPLDLTFTDDHGQTLPLRTYFGKIPALFMLVYYRCPMLCSEEMEGMASALKMINFRPGKDFNIIAISIDPTETPAIAAAKKQEILKMYGRPETAGGWHFMTGTQQNIDQITQAAGFKYVKLQVPGTNLHEYAHASSLEIVTPQGKLAQYYMGVEYSPKDMLLGLDEASNDRIGSPVDNILTYCYHYDPASNTHDLIVSRVVQLGGAVTLVMLGGFMFIMLRKDFQLHDHPGVAGDGLSLAGSKTGAETHGTGKKVNG